MVFEDLQWADESLLDFVEYLLEWSRNSPLYVLTLSRPELAERRPTWGAGRRNFTSLYLEPLAPAAMRELLDGLVPGLPASARDQILERAEGVPLYAVETARMLLDRGLLVEDGQVYRLTGSVESLEIPETLHALIAARLDGLTPDERRLLQDASVLGKTFTREALVAVSGGEAAALEASLASLLRKEVLTVQADPRSPEHGQYGFLQDLVRHVAYETLSRRDRLARHLKAAEHLQSSFPDDDEVVEVVAAHYLEAVKLGGDADDAPAIRTKAREMLVRAADRAASLAASDEARRYLDHAAELADDALERARLLDRAGQMAWKSGSAELATAHLQAAIAGYESEGDVRAAARAARHLGDVEVNSGRLEEAIERMERAFATLERDEPDESVAWLAAELATAYWFRGDGDRAAELAELALDIGESLGLPEVVLHALLEKGRTAGSRGHVEEAVAFLSHGLKLALDNDLLERATAAYFNLSDMSFRRDRYRESVEYLNAALAQARRGGDRLREWEILSELTYPLYQLGEWDGALEALAEIPSETVGEAGVMLSPLTSVLELHIHRGSLDDARSLFALYDRLGSSADIQERACYAGAKAALARGEGRLHDALAAAKDAVESAESLGLTSQATKQGFVEGVEAAFALGDVDTVEELLGRVEPLPRGQRGRYLEAHAKRFRARLDEDEAGYAAAAAIFRELEIPFWLAVTLVEHAELLNGEGEPQLDEATEIFERLGAESWLARVSGSRTRGAVPAPR
jgi:tetratricopeptide (TPR) repeat protein